MRGIRKKATLGTILLGLLMLFTLVSASFPLSVSAQGNQFRWIDETTIQADNFRSPSNRLSFFFKDSNPDDITYEFTNPDTGMCNIPKLTVSQDNPAIGNLTYYRNTGGVNGAPQCEATQLDVNIGDTQNANKDIAPISPDDYRSVTYTWADADTINASGTVTDSFKKDGDKFSRVNDKSLACGKDYITVDANDKAKGTLTIPQQAGRGCNNDNNPITIANATAAGNATTADKDSACTLAVGTTPTGKSTSWFICAFTDTIYFFVNTFDNYINTLLQPDLTIFDKNGPYHGAWNSFRVIALAIVVIAALIMVISQAAGIEILDAYTIRKILPRLLAAALFITISWDVLEVLFRLCDAATTGIRSLIYAPFNTLDPIQLGGGSAFTGLLLGGGALVALGWLALLSFGASAALGVTMAGLALILMKVATTGVVIGSGVAIATKTAPGLEKAYEFWKGALISLLLAPVAVGAIIALFRAGAVIAYNRSSGNAAVNQIIAIILYFGVYFAIFKILAMVGGVAATITGAVSNRAQGAFQGLQKFRSNRFKKNMQDMAAGERYKGNNFLSSGFNAATRGATAFGKSDAKLSMLRPGFGEKGRERRREAWSSALEQHDATNAARYAQTERAKAAQHNDPLLQAQTYRTEAEARANMARDWGMSQQEVESAIQAAKVNGGFSYQKQVYATKRLSETGTGYKDLKQLHQTVSRVAGNNTALRSNLLGEINASTKGAGRFDLATGYANQMSIQQAQRDYEAGRITQAQYEARIQQGYVESVKGTDAVSMLRSKPAAMTNTMPALRQALEEARANGDNEEAGRLAKVIENYQQSGAYASPDNVGHVERLAAVPTQGTREAIAGEARQFKQVWNAQTKRMETEYVPVRDAAGNAVMDPRTGQPQIWIDNRATVADPATGAQVPNPGYGRPVEVQSTRYNPDTARGVQEQTSYSPFNPDDPRNQR